MDKLKIPTHLAIILDGNGRWAKAQGLIRTMGHQEGAKRLKEVIKASFEMGIKYLSVYAFSTENWKRPKEEVDYLMSLPVKFFNENLDSFKEKGWRIVISGDLSELSLENQEVCKNAMEATKNCTNNLLNICLNYGSQDEIIKACKELAIEVKENKLDVNSITKEEFEKHLYTSMMPPVDLLIRTSNEQRISNFLLWQISYAEFYFTKTMWPCFTKSELEKAIKEYSSRDRRFGGVK